MGVDELLQLMVGAPAERLLGPGEDVGLGRRHDGVDEQQGAGAPAKNSAAKAGAAASLGASVGCGSGSGARGAPTMAASLRRQTASGRSLIAALRPPAVKYVRCSAGSDR